MRGTEGRSASSSMEVGLRRAVQCVCSLVCSEDQEDELLLAGWRCYWREEDHELKIEVG